MANSVKNSVNQILSFREPILPPDASQQSGISTPSVSFLQPSNMQIQDTQQMKDTQPPPNTISLSTLIDFVVYKTYHDITVMSDILPSKNDLERKTAIVGFSSRTRQIFVRLLSLVKWANSVAKVVRCSDISTFLDRQANHFVDAADKFHILANQLVVEARLPNFSVPAAIDVLTTGTYPRLPLCIRERIIPPDPVKPEEKKATLKRINQIILYRLVTEYIPPQIVEVKVEQGFVLLHVPNEFKAFVTLMGDGPDIPWRILKLEFLVDDFDIGNGRSLVHPFQVNYIHELVQSRLFANEKPLKDLFDLLHSFCLSLQLEVLYAQVNRLISVRWGKFLHVEEYKPSVKLTVSYWRINFSKTSSVPCSVTIQQSLEDPSKPLQVVHCPQLTSTDGPNLIKYCSHINHLSLEYLIHCSILARSYDLLNQVKEMLYKHIRHDASYFSKDDQRAVLYVPLLNGWKECECLCLLIDPQTGNILPSLHDVPCVMLDKMEKEINESRSLILQWYQVLSLVLAKLRCKLAVQHLPVICLDQLNIQKPSLFDGDSLFIKFLRHPSYYLVVVINPDPKSPSTVKYDYYLMVTCLESMKKHGHHNPGNVVLSVKSVSKLNPQDTFLYPDSLSNFKNSINTELVHMVVTCISRVPYLSLIDGLENIEIDHQGIQEEGDGMGLVCNLISLSRPTGINRDVHLLLKNAVALCSFRVTDRGGNKFWVVELTMRNPPIRGYLDKDDGLTNLAYFMYDAFTFTHLTPQKDVMKLFLQDWRSVAHLYGPVVVFAERISQPDHALARLIRVHSYNYKTITIQYGRSFNYGVTINWVADKNFVLRFTHYGSTSSSNAHVLVRHYLTENFNSNPDIDNLMQVLVDTSSPLQAISRLPCTPLPGIQMPKSTVDLLFAIIPQTPTHIRVFFLGSFCLDVYCREDGRVALRDGAFSQFQFSKVKNTIIPIPGLAKFLSKFVDSSDTRPVADTEKDNPSSPNSTQQAPPALLELPHTAAYSGANVTLLLHSSLEGLLAPSSSMSRSFNGHPLSCALECFFGAALSRRYINKCVLSTDHVDNIPMQQNTDGADASLASAFVTRSLQFVCYPQDMRRLVMKVHPAAVSQNLDSWSSEDLQILEKFFEMRVTCSPYRNGAMKSFFNIISAPTPILKDLINLIKIEMLGSRIPGFNPKWAMSLCLTGPPALTVGNVGEACVLVKDKVLIFIQLTPLSHNVVQGPLPIFAVPLLYEPTKNHISVLNVALQNASSTPELQAVSNIIARMVELKRQNLGGQVTLAVAVRSLMEAFVASGITN